ncbi:MAG: hypothetical protein ACXWL2_00965 [Candidatus Chromulinivorax sp.]
MIKKHTIFITLLILNQYISTLAQSEQSKPTVPVVNITFSNYNNNDQNQLANHQSELAANHKNDIQTQVHTNQINWQKQLNDIFQERLNLIKKNSEQASDWVQSHKIISVSLFCSTIYGYLFYQIYTANQIINDPNAWCNWNYKRTIDDLFVIPQKQLESEILFAVQNRYVDKENPINFIYSIVQVLQAIQEETLVLQNQINRYDLILKCYCNNIFFITQQDLIDLQEKQRKLSFIKHILTSWCASYKIDKNKI